MSIDQHREHAQGLVVLDKAHAPHIGGEVIDLVRAFGGRLAVLFQIQVEHQVLDVLEYLIPFVDWFDVHGADLAISLAAKFGHQRASDKAARARYHE